MTSVLITVFYYYINESLLTTEEQLGNTLTGTKAVTIFLAKYQTHLKFGKELYLD